MMFSPQKHRSHLSKRERQSLSRLYQLLKEPGLLRASFMYMRRRCGRDYCRCNRSKRNWHGSWYVIRSHGGKKQMQHVSSKESSIVRQWVNQYQRIKKHLNVISDLYWKKLKKS